ncbi:MAG: 3-deoxy-D-manno-octulosonic acid transferase [Pirellulaceae bacterium]
MPNVFDFAYVLALGLASPWLAYGAWRHGKYREGWHEKLRGQIPRRSSYAPCAWFHAVSVGEVNLLKPLLDRWSRQFPEWECVISTTTRTGYELARQKYVGRTVFYCPLDFSWAVREACERVRPQLLVLAELELWPNLVHTAHRRGCRIGIVNGRLSERSARGYARIKPVIRRLLERVDVVAVQNDEYAARFRGLGAPDNRVLVTGSVKFDGVQTERANPATLRLRQLAGVADDDIVFLAGSTQAPEEEVALLAFRELADHHPRLRLILVPRHTTRCDEIARMLDRHEIPWQRRSQLDRTGPRAAARVLLVDTIGELSAWWGAAQIAFVGGSLGSRGGQNMIEPAGYGAAISFGPNTRNFRDIVQALVGCRGAQIVRDGTELRAFVQWCLDEPAGAAAMGRRAQELVIAQRGATDRTIDALARLVDTSLTRRSAA